MESLGSQSAEGVEGTQKSNTRFKNFTVDEDLLLCSAWSNTTKDGATGINQSSDTFWSKAHTYWLEHKGESDEERNPKGLMQRFSTIRTAVNKFTSCLTQVSSLSGYTGPDKIKKAKEMYKELESKNNEGKKRSKTTAFLFKHCWNELKKDQKWLEINNVKKPTAHEDPYNTPSPINITDNGEDLSSTPIVVETPVGKKLAKEGRTKRKGKFEYDSSPLLEKLDHSFCHGDKVHNDNTSLYLESEKKMDVLLEMKKKKLHLEEQKLEMDREMFTMDMALKEAEFMKIDVSALKDPDEIDFVQGMKKKIKIKYQGKE